MARCLATPSGANEPWPVVSGVPDNLFLGMAPSFRKLCLGFIQCYLNLSICFDRQYGQFGHPFRGISAT